MSAEKKSSKAGKGDMAWNFSVAIEGLTEKVTLKERWQTRELIVRLVGGGHFFSGSVVKNPSANAGYTDSIPGPDSSLGKGNGKLFRYSCLKIPMDSEAWRARVHSVTKSQTGFSDWTPTVFCGSGVRLRDQTLQKPSGRNSPEQQGSL